ncbi:unnamed protein product, partial [Brenthis ino]
MDDSSPDLSLKLRRGSSDSRESFYMDFAQGIDSDIEEVTTIERIIPEHPGGRAEGDADTLATPSGLDDKDLSQWYYFWDEMMSNPSLDETGKIASQNLPKFYEEWDSVIILIKTEPKKR